MGTASASGDGETVGAAVSAGRGCAEGVDVDGNSGVADATSGVDVFVGSGGGVVAMDAAGGGAGGASGEHAIRMMTRQANRTMPIFVMAKGGLRRWSAP